MSGGQIQKIGRYVIQREIGRGGMAVVYQAYDPRLDRTVAIKLILSEVFGANLLDKMHERFEREARALGKLDHPNIVRVFDYGEHEGSPYLIMDFIDGMTLHELKKPMPLAEAIRLLAPVAEALDYVHRQGMLHRDVKPSNILITKDSRAILTDFGIVKQMEDAHGKNGLTGVGVGIGTPDYMSPEQGLGKDVDERSDMYSLAVVLYELVTGTRPYVGDTPVEIIMNHVKQPLPDPRRIVPSLPETAVAFFERALAKDAKNRYPTMDNFLRDLYGLRLGTRLRDSNRTISPELTPVTEMTVHRPALKTHERPSQARKRKKQRLVWAAVSAVFLALGVGGYFARDRIQALLPLAVSATPTNLPPTETAMPSETVLPTETAMPTETRPAVIAAAANDTAMPIMALNPSMTMTYTASATLTMAPSATTAPTATLTGTAALTATAVDTATAKPNYAAARQAKELTLAAATQTAAQLSAMQTQSAVQATATPSATPRRSLNDLRATADSLRSQNRTETFSKLEVGELVSFGRYEQDNVSANGAEEIQWRVLAVDEESAILISEIVLAMRPYHSQVQPVNWDMSSLRSWLNQDFYNAAFNAAEKECIALTRLPNDDTPNNYYTDDGKETDDYVFLLRSEDLDVYYPKIPDRKTAASAVVNELRKDQPFGTNHYAAWWLRSLGTDTFKAVVVEIDGTLKYTTGVESAYVGVRPVIRIYLELE